MHGRKDLENHISLFLFTNTCIYRVPEESEDVETLMETRVKG